TISPAAAPAAAGSSSAPRCGSDESGRVPLRGAALPLVLLVPGRRLAAGGAGPACGRAGLCGARPDRPQLALRLDGAGPGRGGLRDEPAARRLLEAFGSEGLYVELQRPYARHDRARNRALAALAGRLGVRCVATGDVHAHTRARAELQDAFVALRHHTTLDAS